ncbi:MAG: class I SAM-dependent methyltransferase [Agarilytica sp.]
MKVLKYIFKLNIRCSRFLENKFPTFFGYISYSNELKSRIDSSIKDNSDILEVGGIDRPLLSKNQRYVYDGVDIEPKEKCHEIYDNFFVQTIEKPLNKSYDVIISITLLEHVLNNTASVKNIFSSLKDFGETHHYIPSKWHPYAIALRIVGPKLQKRLIPILRPGTEDVTGYPAYFDHCSIPAMRRLLDDQGFSKIQIKAYYRANDYFAFFTPFFIIITLFENLCKKFNLEIFASGFIVSAQKISS